MTQTDLDAGGLRAWDDMCWCERAKAQRIALMCFMCSGPCKDGAPDPRPQPEAVSAGEWVLVPRVPTEAMLEAGSYAAFISRLSPGGAETGQMWSAMLAATPPAPAEQGGEKLRDCIASIIYAVFPAVQYDDRIDDICIYSWHSAVAENLPEVEITRGLADAILAALESARHGG